MNLLTRKIGPLPAWVWGGAAAVAAWFFFLRGKGPGAGARPGSSSSSTTPGGQATTDYSLGYSQGLQSAVVGLGQTVSTTTKKFVATLRGNTNPETGQAFSGTINIPVFDSQFRSTGTTLPEQSQVTVTGGPVSNGGKQYYPIDMPGGQTGYILAQDVTNLVQQSTGGGVGGPVRKHAIGSRAAAPIWSDAHPLVGAPVRYSHYVRAVGGPGNHQRELHRVAAQSGVHPARVAMLNPTPTGMIRVA